MSANNVLAADAAAFCAKHGQSRSEKRFRQVAPGRHRLFFQAQLIIDLRDAPCQKLFEPRPDVLPPRDPYPTQA